MRPGENGNLSESYIHDTLSLEAEDILGLYARLFQCSPEAARNRLRDPARLASAVARPKHYAQYQSADLALQAAVLAHGIAEGQVFLDGNKRTALAALTMFLALNG